jgi:2-oxoisovalerate dehydrogenase E1 component
MKKTNQYSCDWERIAKLLLTSRYIDEVEEQELVPQKKIAYQFSAKGHELAQVLLSSFLTHKHDGASVYYRSRPFVLSQGLTIEEAFASSMAKEKSMSGGRDIGVVFNMHSRGNATILPTSGDVGSQYTPAVGWAQAIRYYQKVLKQKEWNNAIAVACGGDGSVASNGFWSALNIATTLKLPILFCIEDNGYGISTPSSFQTSGRNVVANLRAFKNLFVLEADGCNPKEVSEAILMGVDFVREGKRVVLLRVDVPRIMGHSFVDTQSYKSEKQKKEDAQRDPLFQLKKFLIPKILSEKDWKKLETETIKEVDEAKEKALAQSEPEIESGKRFVFSSQSYELQVSSFEFNEHNSQLITRNSQQTRVTMIDAIRKTLESEMQNNPHVVVFGEDVAVKGGVHGATVDLLKKFGRERVFDTSLSEEGIIGRAVGMSLAGLRPVPEIQFRKYADPATEQINNCGTIRWRTNNNFSAPLVVRIPVGVGKKTGDPWHSVTGEAIFAHTLGWRIAFPSNAEDAVGLLRSALRGNDPTMFFEHRTLYDSLQARRSYPRDDFEIPFGKANVVQEGNDATIVSWGEMLHRSMEATKQIGASVDIIDLRTIIPWDKETVLNSIKKTGKCLLVHEDQLTSGFGAEISATISQEAFQFLDAPIVRVATSDNPISYNLGLMESIVPSVEKIKSALEKLLAF